LLGVPDRIEASTPAVRGASVGPAAPFEQGSFVMQVGQRVEVHNRFNDSWSQGFEVDGVTGEGYRLRRLSDGALLPILTSEADVRSASAPGAWGAVSPRR